MKRRPLSRRRLRIGFTLMEVLLVMVILVVVAGFAIRNLAATQESTRKQQAKIMASTLSTSLKEYQLQVGTLPSSLDALHVQPSDLQDASMWVQKLEKPVPLDPWGKAYEYKPNGTSFTISSMGPDGQSGTADDVTP
jgi:general secretion pathway protein G